MLERGKYTAIVPILAGSQCGVMSPIISAVGLVLYVQNVPNYDTGASQLLMINFNNNGLSIGCQLSIELYQNNGGQCSAQIVLNQSQALLETTA